MIQLSMVTAAAAVKLVTQHTAAALSRRAALRRRSTTTKEVGGVTAPPQHELKPDNETSTRFHRAHKASAKSPDVGLVN